MRRGNIKHRRRGEFFCAANVVSSLTSDIHYLYSLEGVLAIDPLGTRGTSYSLHVSASKGLSSHFPIP